MSIKVSIGQGARKSQHPLLDEMIMDKNSRTHIILITINLALFNLIQRNRFHGEKINWLSCDM